VACGTHNILEVFQFIATTHEGIQSQTKMHILQRFRHNYPICLHSGAGLHLYVDRAKPCSATPSMLSALDLWELSKPSRPVPSLASPISQSTQWLCVHARVHTGISTMWGRVVCSKCLRAFLLLCAVYICTFRMQQHMSCADQFWDSRKHASIRIVAGTSYKPI